MKRYIAVVSMLMSAVILLSSCSLFSSETRKKLQSFEKCVVGDCITFGEYEQDNDFSNGKEEIEWIVLEKQEDKILVISKYVLDCQPYNYKQEEAIWEKCDLRKWLNHDFINNAFSRAERSAIPTVTVEAYSSFAEFFFSDEVDLGVDTEDQIYILSHSEASKYLPYNSDRYCKPTTYACRNGAKESYSDGGTCCWWLRMGDSRQDTVNHIPCGESCKHSYEVEVSRLDIGVRPVMWIEFD